MTETKQDPAVQSPRMRPRPLDAWMFRIEVLVWVLFIPTLYLILSKAPENQSGSYTLTPGLDRALLAMFVSVSLSMIFRLSFGEFPLAAIRNWFYSKSFSARIVNASEPSERRQSRAESYHQMKLEAYLAEVAVDSRGIANGIHGRAQVYLFVGGLIALGGIALFYSQNHYVLSVDSLDQLKEVGSIEPRAVAIYLGTRFGALLFIEVLALFFLRQYRAAMQDYRFFDGVRRSREELLSLVKYTITAKLAIEPLDLAKLHSSVTHPGFVKQPEQAEGEVKSRGLIGKEEAGLLGKIIDLIGKSAKNGGSEKVEE